jgi:uncharacterized protein (DUF433 family)
MSQVVSGVVKDGVIVPEAPLPEGRRVEIGVPNGVPADEIDTALIHDRGRGPEIKGTRITVYSILDYLIAGWHHTQIAALFRISSAEVLAAMEYIRGHQAAVMADYARILERAERGNPPELQAKIDAGHERFKAFVARVRSLPDTDPEARRQQVAKMVREYREAAKQEAVDARHNGR